MSENAQKPRIRFRGFSDAWEQRKFGEIGSVSMCRRIFKEQTSETGDIPFYKIGTFGTEPDAFISRDLFEEYKSKYPYPKKGDILISASGSIGRTVEFAGNNEYFQDSNIVWLSHDERLSNSFLKCFYSVVKWAGIEGSTIKRLYNDNILNTVICMPSVSEQERIGLFFENLDNLITLHQCKSCKKVVAVQSAFSRRNLSKWTDSWEQRKFGETVQIERGGSPRPIDDFITTAPDGLNWVKIGDAPEQGNYITKTAEKIKPSGLSKTREVHPNDLILSNSMSFGKPYIMAINGCIHDGWLLIRDNQERFELKFLCHLLGTSQMLSQYRSMAAGSTVNNLNKELVGNTTITFPTKQEQQKIGNSFELLDNLITLHQCKVFSKNIIFKNIKFGGLGTENNTSWEQRKLNEVVNVYDGVHQTPDYKDSGVMFLSVENISTLKSEKYISEEAFQRDYKVYPQKGDILMTRIGDVGTPNVVETTEKVAFYVSLALLKPTKINSYFLCNSIQSPLFQKGLKDRTLVTAIPQKINKDEIGKVNIILPTSSREQQLIGDYFRNLDNLITLHQEHFVISVITSGWNLD